MDVHLNPEIEKIVRGKLQTGNYTSASEIVYEALRLLEQRDEIRSKINQGLQSLQAGRGLSEHEAFNELRSRHERYKRNQQE